MSGVREEAARWFARMHALPAGAEGDAVRTACAAWQAADPAHAAEYASFESLWRDFDSTPQLQALAGAASRRQGVRRRAAVRGVLGVAGVGLLGLLVGRGWQAFQDAETYARALDTAIGQRTTLRLPDGSTVALGAASAMALRFSRRNRAVVLERGEAVFDVARDPDRPFTIDAGPAQITVVGTRFAVGWLPGLVRVSVAHGAVRLAAQGRDAPLLLQAGEVGEVSFAEGDATAPPQRVQRNAQDAFSAVERGLVVFDEAGLAEIAATLSRYLPRPVRGPAPSAHGPRITAVVQARDMANFLRDLPRIAAVRVQEREGVVWLAPR